MKVDFLDKKWRFRTVCRTLYNQVKYRTQKLSFTLPKDIPIFFLIVQVCQHFGKLPCISKSVEMRDDLITFLIFIAFSKKHKPRNVQITIKKIVLFFGKENRPLNNLLLIKFFSHSDDWMNNFQRIFCGLEFLHWEWKMAKKWLQANVDYTQEMIWFGSF